MKRLSFKGRNSRFGKGVLLLCCLLFFSCAHKDKSRDRGKKIYRAGVSYLRSGSLEMAEKELLEAKKLRPGDAAIHSSLGEVYYAKKRFELAIPQFQEAKKIDPAFSDPYFFLGNIYLGLRRWDEAIREFRDLLRLTTFGFPHIVHNALGIAYQNKGESVKAIKEFRSSLNYQADFPITYYNLGMVYLKLNDPEQAIIEFKKAVKLLPDYLEAYNQLGLIYLKRGEKKLARENFKKIVELLPESELGKEAKNYLDLLK